MAYQLMIKDRGKYKPIKIRNHSSFIIDSSLLREEIASLKEIDLLTTQYTEADFRKSLVNEKLVDEELINCTISIRYPKKEKMVTMTDSLIYIDGKSYLCIDNLLKVLKFLKIYKKRIEKFARKAWRIYYER